MAGRPGGGIGDGRGKLALDRNLLADPGPGRAFVIEFGVNPVLTHRPHFNPTQTSWIAVTFGTTAAFRWRDPHQNDGVGLLFRGDGRTQAFNNGSDLGQGRYAPAADDDVHHIRIEVYDPTDGNPFDGSGPAVILAYADGSPDPFFAFERAGGFVSNYLSLISYGEGSGGDGIVRHALVNLLLRLDGCTCARPGGGPGLGSPHGLVAADFLAALVPASRPRSLFDEPSPSDEPFGITVVPRPVSPEEPTTPARVPDPYLRGTVPERSADALLASWDHTAAETDLLSGFPFRLTAR